MTSTSWVIYRLPREYWHCALENFEWEGIKPDSLRQRVQTFVAAIVAGHRPHLLLTGDPGIGKTHLGVGVYRAASAVLGTELVTWLNIPMFCEAVKSSYKEGGGDAWADVEAAKRLVVLDDLFGRELTPHEKDQIITRLFDTAYTNGAAVLITMNPPHTELSQRLPPHEISRLLADCLIIPVSAPKDRRRE